MGEKNPFAIIFSGKQANSPLLSFLVSKSFQNQVTWNADCIKNFHIYYQSEKDFKPCHTFAGKVRHTFLLEKKKILFKSPLSGFFPLQKKINAAEN